MPAPEQDKQVWSDIAQLYDRIIPEFPYYRELRQKVITAMAPTTDILDCGCGTGLISMKLLEAGHNVRAIDNSPEMLKLVYQKRETLAPEVRDRFSVEAGDPADFSSHFQESELFDGVVCNNVLFFVQDPKEVMRQLHRLTRPQGRVAFSGPIPNADIDLLHQVAVDDFKKRGIYEALAPALASFYEFSIQLKQSGHRNTYTASQLSQILLDEIGFRRIVQADQDTYCGQSYFVIAEK